MTTTRPALSTAWDVLLRDGRIAQVRSLLSPDEDQLRALNGRLSARTRLMRYFSVGDQPGEWYVDHLLQQAGTGNALVAVVDDEIVAVASFVRLESDPRSADIGVLVDDDHQDSGVGSLLLEHLAHVARHHGITSFHADVLAENGSMLRMLRSSGYGVTTHVVDSVMELEIDLDPVAPARDAMHRRDVVAERASLERVLAPRTCVIVGSRRDGTVGARVSSAIRSFGYPGLLHHVNAPHGLLQLRAPVDLVVVAVPASNVIEVAQDAAAVGAAGLLVLSAGFAEDGPEGRERQGDLLQVCRRSGMRLVGPNCLGILNAHADVRLNATFAEAAPPPGHVALVSQSGAVGVAALRNAERRRTGLSMFVSTGNKADVSGNDLLEYLAEDDQTSVIALYLESFGNPRKFGEIVRRVARSKPVVVVKSGRSPAGARAGQSHTAAAATPDVATDALLRSAGAIRADDMRELFDLVGVLQAAPVPRGSSVAVIGNSGGPGVLAIDALAAAGLRVADLAEETCAAIRRHVPSCASVQNPVDLLSTVTPTEMRDAVVALMQDEGVDAVISIYTPVTRRSEEAFAAALVEASAAVPHIPLLTTFPGVAVPPESLRRPDQPDLPFCEFPEQAAQVLAKIAAYSTWLAAPPAEPATPGTSLRSAELDKLVIPSDGVPRWLGPGEVGRLLQAIEVPSVPSVVVRDVSAALGAADVLGYPVVLKAHGLDLVHKSDLGAVVLGLRDGTELAAAWLDLHARLADKMTCAEMQRQLSVSEGVELVAGAYRDDSVGPLVMAGLGGTMTDILDDRVLRVPPTTREAALAQLNELRCAPALKGFRGHPPLAADAVADVLVALGRLMSAFPEVREVDLNPLLVTPTGAWALDARISVATADDGIGAPFRALRPPLSRRQQ